MTIKLKQREKYALYIAGGFMVLFLAIQFVVFPIIDHQKLLNRTLRVKLESLKEIRNLKSSYDQITQRNRLSKRRFAQREKGFTLFSFLDKLAGENGLKDKIIYMKPSSSAQKDKNYKISLVEMKLQPINLKQLVTYMYHVETSVNMVFIKRLSISKTEKENGLISAVLNVETYDI